MAKCINKTQTHYKMMRAASLLYMNATTSLSENVKSLLLNENFLISVFGSPFDTQAKDKETDMSYVSLYSAAEIDEARNILLHLDTAIPLTSSADMTEIRAYIASYLKKRHEGHRAI